MCDEIYLIAGTTDGREEKVRMVIMLLWMRRNAFITLLY